MSTVALCRVCLASNTKMHHIANTPHQEIFEKLAMELCTADGRPETVCCVCLSALQRGRWLADTARAAHEILTQLSLSGIQLNDDTVSVLERKYIQKLAWTPIQTLSINKGYEPIKVEFKQEPSENDLTDLESELYDETQVLDQPQAEMRNTQALLMLTHTEMDLAQEKQTGAQEIHTGCQTTFNMKEERISDDKVSEPNCSENNFFEIQIGKTELTDDVEKFIGNKKRSKEVGTSDEGTRIRPADVKQEMVEVLAEFEVAFTHRPEETPESKSKKPKKSYEILVRDWNGQERVKHACPQCESTYVHRCHLLRHIRMHNEGERKPSRNFCCETCGKAFYTKSALKKHRLCHSDEKRFYCDHCPAKCSQKIDIERHMYIHTGQKYYQCDVCKKRSNRKSNMLLHILTHMNSKPFACHICNMAFSRKYDVDRHIRRKHICEKPYACDICEFRSVNASYIKKHMANMHLKLKEEKP